MLLGRIPRQKPRYLAIHFLLLSISIDSQAMGNDHICFPLYRDAGAIPGTGLTCKITASAASVNLSNYFCTSSSGSRIIERYCGNLPKDLGDCKVGNPIAITTGNKSIVEQDYIGSGIFPLIFERHYNSTAVAAPGKVLGYLWRSNYDRNIVIDGNIAMISRPDGRIYYFEKKNNKWVTSADNKDQLVELTGATAGWRYANSSNDSIEVYDSTGRLQTITARNGQVHTMVYSTSSTPISIAPAPDYLIGVKDSFGNALSFSWGPNKLLETLTDPAGNVYRYDYDVDKRLTSVSYPSLDATKPKKTYLYNEPTYTSGADLPEAITGLIDENNVRLATYTYSADGKGSSTENAGGANKYSLAYTTNQTRITDPLGTERVLDLATVVGVKQIKQSSQPAGSGCPASAQATTYDLNGNIASSTDFNNIKTTFVYDLARNLETKRIEAAGTADARTITTVWHPTLNIPVKIYEPLLRTTFVHDSLGNIKEIELQSTADTTGDQGAAASVIGATRKWAYTFDSYGQITAVDGPRTDVLDITKYTYNTQGQLATETNALGYITRYTDYDANGQLLSVTDPNGITTKFTWHPRGWLLGSRILHPTTPSQDTVMLYHYDAAGQLVSTKDAGGVELYYEYDEAHRLKAVRNLLGERIEYTLDNFGNRTRQDIKSTGGSITYSVVQVFDALSRVMQVTGNNGQDDRFQYDANGNDTLLTDGRSNSTQQVSDTLNRVKKVIDPNLGETSLTYNSRDEIRTIVDARGNATTYTYDGGLGNLLSETNPDTGATNYVYDAAGNRIQSVDSRSVITNYTYDALNRIKTIQYPAAASENVTFIYDQASTTNSGIGRLSRVNKTGGNIAYLYDHLGSVKQKDSTPGGVGKSIKYAFDNAGRLTKVIYPSLRHVDYSYDSQGRISGITTKTGSAAALTIISNATYFPFGPVNQFTYGNGLIHRHSVDLDYRLKEINVGTVFSRNYDHDIANNIASIINNLNSTKNQSLGYDGLNRLVSASGSYGNLAYAYDSVGNRTSETRNGVLNTYAYPANSNRLSEIIRSTGNRNFIYDSAGNMLQRTGDDNSVQTATFNNANRMDSIKVNGITTQYAYDGLGQRTVKTLADGTREIYFYDEDGHLLAVTNSTGAILREYIYWEDQQIALINNGTLYFIHSDHLNTPQVITNAAKNVVWSADYEPFGKLTLAPGSTLNHVSRFPGQYADNESGLYYNYYRDYDPSIGRYIESDPIGLEGGVNTYAYVNGNPTGYVDPTGEIGLPGAALGGGIDLLFQLSANGGNFKCIDWGQVGMSAAMGAVGGVGASIGRAYTKNAFKHSVSNMTWKESSKKWKTVSQRYRKYINDSGVAPAKKWEAHHWFIERNGKFNNFFNKKIPEYVLNHPLNLHPMPKGNHRRMTGKWGKDKKYNLSERWWYGTPSWYKQGQAAGGAAGGAAGAGFGGGCECNN